jgi:hypothetical protein
MKVYIKMENSAEFKKQRHTLHMCVLEGAKPSICPLLGFWKNNNLRKGNKPNITNENRRHL